MAAFYFVLSYLIVIFLLSLLSLAPYLFSPAAGEGMRGGGRVDGRGLGRLTVLCEVDRHVVQLSKLDKQQMPLQTEREVSEVLSLCFP